MTEAERNELYVQIMEGSSTPVQFSTTVGLVFDRLDPTGAEGHFLAAKELCNPFGIVHGGVYYTLMDQLAGMAASSSGRGAVTLNANVSYLRAARVGDVVRCRLTAVHLGGTVAVYRGECRGEDGTLFCTGEFHLFLKKPLEEML